MMYALRGSHGVLTSPSLLRAGWVKRAHGEVDVIRGDVQCRLGSRESLDGVELAKHLIEPHSIFQRHLNLVRTVTCNTTEKRNNLVVLSLTLDARLGLEMGLFDLDQLFIELLLLDLTLELGDRHLVLTLLVLFLLETLSCLLDDSLQSLVCIGIRAFELKDLH